MQINFDVQLKDVDGNVMMEGPDRPSTLGLAVARALDTPLVSDGPNADVDDKIRRYVLMKECRFGTVEVSVEDLALIKHRVGQTYTASVVGQCFELLDPGCTKRK